MVCKLMVSAYWSREIAVAGRSRLTVKWSEDPIPGANWELYKMMLEYKEEVLECTEGSEPMDQTQLTFNEPS